MVTWPLPGYGVCSHTYGDVSLAASKEPAVDQSGFAFPVADDLTIVDLTPRLTMPGRSDICLCICFCEQSSDSI